MECENVPKCTKISQGVPTPLRGVWDLAVICLKQSDMYTEAILIINSVLVSVSLYFVRDFHKDFKILGKKVGKLSGKVAKLSRKIKQKKK